MFECPRYIESFGSKDCTSLPSLYQLVRTFVAKVYTEKVIISNKT